MFNADNELVTIWPPPGQQPTPLPIGSLPKMADTS